MAKFVFLVKLNVKLVEKINIKLVTSCENRFCKS